VSIDLHVHSTASDGIVPPAQLVADAIALGLHGLAISDHDTIDGIAPAIAAASGTALTLVPAIELSAVAEDGRGLHVLGYLIDVEDPALLSRLARFRADRHERAMRMVEALRTGGYRITGEDVMREAGEGAVGRAHVARALVKTGGVPTMGAAFRDLIGRHGPFFVAKPQVSPEEVVSLIADAGGIAVLAHPGVSKVDDLIEPLVRAGLRGLEVWHSEQSAEDSVRYAAMAEGLGLLRTGGSDFHGPSSSGGGKCLGCVDVPDSALDALLAAPR
jgi:predicted metal-dependent phosphoesterase TrpH